MGVGKGTIPFPDSIRWPQWVVRNCPEVMAGDCGQRPSKAKVIKPSWDPKKTGDVVA